MIQSIDGLLIVGEGGRINVYKFVKDSNELTKLTYVDNKVKL